jgi:hypothetical protein
MEKKDIKKEINKNKIVKKRWENFIRVEEG